MKRFHIGYYIAENKIMISGRTYVAESIIEAIEKYLVEQKDIALVKYVVEMDEFGTFETNKNE